MYKKNIYKYILPVEVIIMLALGILLVVQWRTNQNLGFAITDWKSDYTTYNSEQGWYIDEKLVKTPGENEKVDVVYGPGNSLKKGTYSAKITYFCSSDQSCLVSAGGYLDLHLKTGEVRLSRNYGYLVYDFELKEDIDDFKLVFRYNGEGVFQIFDVAITPNANRAFRNISLVFALFTCLNLCILFADNINKNKNTLLALLGIGVLASLPLFTDGIALGHDIHFHLMRIEGIAKELRLGVFPVRMSSSFIDGYGYPPSIYYGDLLLYIPAFLRLAGFSVTGAYKFYVFMVNTGTAVVTYLSMKSVFKDKRIALLTCVAYCTASYRLINIYERSAVGEYSAMLFMPLVAAAAYKIYTDDISDVKAYRKNALLLAAGMAGLISTHILSTEMVVIVLAVICLSLLKLTCRKETLKVYFLGVLGTCAFSAYFVVPFLDYFINVPTRLGDIMAEGGGNIQKWGITLTEYFSFFRTMHMRNREPANVRMVLTPGLILMVVLVAAVVLWANRRGNKAMKALTVYACMAIAVTLNVFPWDYLRWNFGFGKLLSQVQFPSRYLSIVIIILTLLLGNILAQVVGEPVKIIQSGKAIVIAAFVMTCFLAGDYLDGSIFADFYDGAELENNAIGTGEYLRDGLDRFHYPQISYEVGWERMSEVTVVDRRGSSMELRCVGTDEEGVVWVPMFNYKGYHAMDENGNEYPISDGFNQQIKFSVPAGFDGHIRIVYKEPWYWRVAELVSMLSVFGVCIVVGRNTSLRFRKDERRTL